MIGKTVGSIRRTVDAAPGGNCAMTWLIAALTSSVAAIMSVPHSKVAEISAAPRLVVERRSGDAQKGLLYRCCDLKHHLLGGPVAGIERDPDARELDVGEQCYWQR
jgi:hypothetical protein